MTPNIEKRQGKLSLLDIKRVWSILPKAKKRQAFVLLLFMVVGMIFEMIGVGLVLPVIAFITTPDLLSNERVPLSISQFVNGMSTTELMLWGMASLVVIYSLKNLYLVFLAWKQSSFIYTTQADMAKSLFKLYIHQPYTFHLQRNSADLVNNLQVEMNLFMNYMLSPSILLLAESLVVTGLISLLLYFEPVGTAVVFLLFFLAGLSFQKLTKKRILWWGKKRQQHEALRMKHAQQGINAIKDVKVSGTEDFFTKEYEKNSDESLSMHQKNSFTQNVTRLWLEVLSIAGLSLLSIGMFLQHKTVAEILPVLALFGAVSFRLLPSVNRMISAINLLRFGTSVTELISSEFAKLKPIIKADKIAPIQFGDAIRLKNVSYQYPTAPKKILDNINLEIKKGEMVGIIGESGVGKSTLIDLIMGLFTPTSGDVIIDNVKMVGPVINAWQHLIGYVPQSIYLTDDTLKRNIAFGLDDDEIDIDALYRAIASAQLDSLVAELIEGIDTPLGERGVRLSGGQRQRIGIARALYHNPEVLVLDEATSALDTKTELEVMKSVMLLQGQKTILIIAHRISTLEHADKIIQLTSDGVEVI